ncbi:MAG: cytochrome c oxidase assembly protein [Thermoanaerobaculia bacterium]
MRDGTPAVRLSLGLSRRRARGDRGSVEAPGISAAWTAVTRPLPAFLLQSLTLWIWHLPALYQASLRSDFAHALQHGSFFAASTVFWWALLQGRFGRQGYGAAAIAVFATTLEGGVLGALITFARSLWYPIYEARTAAWGLSPLEDQQLAGILMWVPAGLLLVGFGLALFAAWLGEAERRVALGSSDALRKERS